MCLAGADTSVDAARLAGRLHCGQAAICLLPARFVPTRHSSAETILADQSASLAAAVSAVCHGVLPTPRGAQGVIIVPSVAKFLSTSAAVYSVFGTISSPSSALQWCLSVCKGFIRYERKQCHSVESPKALIAGLSDCPMGSDRNYVNDAHSVCYVSAKPPGALNKIPCSARKDECWCLQEIAACSQHHTELSVVSDWSPNLGFWFLMAPILQLAQPPPLPHEPYSPNQTYIALIASDGDSVQVRSCQC